MNNVWNNTQTLKNKTGKTRESGSSEQWQCQWRHVRGRYVKTRIQESEMKGKSSNNKQ